MARPEDQDLTGQDPLSSAAEGDADPGSAALAAPGEAADGIDGSDGTDDGRPDADGPSFAEAGPPPEAADPEPVTDVVPDSPGTEPA